MKTQIFIQARMSSRRFPGKMLTPVLGRPLIDHIVGAALETGCKSLVLTSDQESDTVLAQHCEAQGYSVFRGNLDNVFLRFQQALKSYPSEYVVRLCGDSPHMNAELLSYLIAFAENEDCDFLSNTIGQTFPRGQSVEIIRASLIEALDSLNLSQEQQEHVTPYFHDHKDQFKTIIVDNKTNLRHINMCIDTPEDLKRIEAGIDLFDFNKDDLCISHT